VGDGLVGVLRAARLTAWLFFVVASRRGRKSQTFATAREDARALWESTVHRAETDFPPRRKKHAKKAFVGSAARGREGERKRER